MITRFALILLFATSTLAQTREITPFIGFQTGGKLDIDSEEQTLATAPAFGLTLSFDRGAGRMLDFLVSHQETSVPTADVSITTFHLGGRYFFRREQRTMPYIAAMAGGTRVGSGNAEAIKFSFASGLGADIRLTPRAALRLDGRLYTTLFGDRANFNCSDDGVCVTNIGGDLLQQFIGSAGLAIRF